MSQTSVDDVNEFALEGMDVDISLDKDRISKLSNDASPIPFGHLVVWNTADNDTQCRLPSEALGAEITNGSSWGVARLDTAREADPNAAVDTAGANTYSITEAVSILRHGRIWVVTEDAVTVIGSPCFVRFAADTFAVLGAFRTDVDTASAVQLPGATFRTTAAIGGLVQVELNL